MTIIERPGLTGHDDIDATIAGLHALAAWRDAHPEIAVAGIDVRAVACARGQSPTDMVRALKDGAPLGSIEKTEGTGDTSERMFIRRDFGGEVNLTFVADRDEVCVRRVTGTETVEVPDPDAPLVKVERDIVEWDCAPILAAS